MSDDIRTELASVRSHLSALHTKSDIAIRVLLHLMGQTDMAIHDEILSALSVNDAALVAVGAKVDSLIAEKSASDAVFSDVLPRVAAQGSAIAALDAKVAGALPAETVAASPEAPAVAADASTAPAPAVAAPAGLVIPGTVG